MSGMLWAGLGLLVIVAGAFMILWIADARRADHVAADPARVPDKSWRRWWRAKHPDS